MYGDLGILMKSCILVWEEFVLCFQVMLEFGVCVMIFVMVVGILVGVLVVVKCGFIFDYIVVGLVLIGYLMFIFWWGMMLIMLVLVYWNLMFVFGCVSDMVFFDDFNLLIGFMLIDIVIWGEDGNFIDVVVYMILFVIVLGIILLVVIVCMICFLMLEVLGEDYICIVCVKGLICMWVIIVYVLCNVMLLVVIVIGL